MKIDVNFSPTLRDPNRFGPLSFVRGCRTGWRAPWFKVLAPCDSTVGALASRDSASLCLAFSHTLNRIYLCHTDTCHLPQRFSRHLLHRRGHWLATRLARRRHPTSRASRARRHLNRHRTARFGALYGRVGDDTWRAASTRLGRLLA